MPSGATIPASMAPAAACGQGWSQGGIESRAGTAPPGSQRMWIGGAAPSASRPRWRRWSAGGDVGPGHLRRPEGAADGVDLPVGVGGRRGPFLALALASLRPLAAALRLVLAGLAPAARFVLVAGRAPG